MSIAPGNTLTGVAFSQNVLAAVVDKLDTSRNDRMFQDLFMKGKQLEVSKDKIVWEKRTFSRGLSPAAQAMSVAPTRQGVGEKMEEADAIITKQSRKIPWTRLMQDDGETPLPAKVQRDIVRTELRDMAGEIGRTVEYVLSGLFTGSLAVNPTTVPGSDVKRTFAFPVRTLSANAAWATAGTKILSNELKLLQDDYETDVGLSPGTIITNNKEHANLIANTEAQVFAAGNADLARYFFEAKNGAPKPLQGLRMGGVNWWSNPHGYKLTSGGSLVKWIADDYAIVLPEEENLEDVLGFADFAIPVPQGPKYGSPGDGFKSVKGLAVWAEFHGNPQCVELHMQRRFGAALTYAEACLYYHTAP